MKNKINGWDFFDRIYCISLEEREDRRQAAAVSFAKVGLTGKVEFVLVKPHPSNIEQGMYESHMTCLRKGLEAGAKNIVVFEDDVIFDRFDAEHFNQCIQFLQENPNWKVLLLGALIRSSQKNIKSVHTKSPLSEPGARVCFKQALRGNPGLSALAGNCY